MSVNIPRGHTSDVDKYAVCIAEMFVTSVQKCALNAHYTIALGYTRVDLCRRLIYYFGESWNSLSWKYISLGYCEACTGSCLTPQCIGHICEITAV